MRAAMDKRLGIELADINISPEQVKGYIATLKAHGMKALYLEVPQATHDAGIHSVQNCCKML
jgi:molybdate-binding protein